MKKLRGDVKDNLNEEMLRRIKSAPKPTKTAEALSIVKEFDRKALSLKEIARVANIADPGKDEKSRKEEYPVKEMKKHPNLRVLATPQETHVRYVSDE